LTAIEAWMLACILFVFGALVEYAVILFRRQTSKDDEAPVRNNDGKMESDLRERRIYQKIILKIYQIPEERYKRYTDRYGRKSKQKI